MTYRLALEVMELKLLDANGKEIEIAVEEIKGMEACFKNVPVDAGRMSLAGPGAVFIKLNMKSGHLEVPRCPQNDSEILTFIIGSGRFYL